MRTLRLARELLDGHDLVKLEVLGDPKSLYPNVVDTLAAAKTLVKEGFKVMVYTSDDPIIARQLEEAGCVAVMPLASLIGSGMGILNPWNLGIIIEQAWLLRILADVGAADRDRDDLGAARFHGEPGFFEILVLARADQESRAIRASGDEERVGDLLGEARRGVHR